jgi:hypothetical protein
LSGAAAKYGLADWPPGRQKKERLRLAMTCQKSNSWLQQYRLDYEPKDKNKFINQILLLSIHYNWIGLF